MLKRREEDKKQKSDEVRNLGNKMLKRLEDLEIELQLKPQDLEIEETGKTFVENAALKASQSSLFWAPGMP